MRDPEREEMYLLRKRLPPARMPSFVADSPACVTAGRKVLAGGSAMAIAGRSVQPMPASAMVVCY